MNLIDANLENLTRLWKRYGAMQITGDAQAQAYHNTRWPHRCWWEGGAFADSDLASFIDGIPESATVSIWPTQGDRSDIERQLERRDWICAFQQTAMSLTLNHVSNGSSSEASFRVQPVKTPAGVKEWIAVGSDAFGYTIDVPVIEQFIDDRDVRLVLGTLDGQAVASALLYKTGDVVGVHQLGVCRAFQGRGLARQLMQSLLVAVAKWQGKTVVLQASEAGLPLYQRLGFVSQFVIKNYQKAV